MLAGFERSTGRSQRVETEGEAFEPSRDPFGDTVDRRSAVLEKNPLMKENDMNQPTAEDALKRLEPLVGEWSVGRDSPER